MCSAFTGVQIQHGCAELRPGSHPRHCYHCQAACTTQGGLLISAGSSWAGISKMLLGLLRPSGVSGLHSRTLAPAQRMEDQREEELWRCKTTQCLFNSFGLRKFHVYEAQEGYKPLASNKGGNGRFSTSMH